MTSEQYKRAGIIDNTLAIIDGGFQSYDKDNWIRSEGIDKSINLSRLSRAVSILVLNGYDLTSIDADIRNMLTELSGKLHNEFEAL